MRRRISQNYPSKSTAGQVLALPPIIAQRHQHLRRIRLRLRVAALDRFAVTKLRYHLQAHEHNAFRTLSAQSVEEINHIPKVL